ncbi:MAG TPA: GldG family protein [Chthoniobacterales bacterium]|nr:GldG family protein [Chthoniobacterales bacterium]
MARKVVSSLHALRVRTAVNVAVQIALTALIVLMLNYLSFNRFGRRDLSRNSKYALSGLTRKFLGSLKKEVKIYVFFSSTATKSPGAELYNDVENLLKEYVYAGKRHVRVETVDPYRDITRARELQEKFRFGSNDNIIILDCDGRQKTIRAVDLADYGSSEMFDDNQNPEIRSFKGEQVLTSALIELIQSKAPKLGMIVGHKELGLDQNGSLNRFRDLLEGGHLQLQEISLNSLDKIPSDYAAVILAGPEYDLSAQEIALLRRYWNEDGRLFVLLNGRAKTPTLDAFLNELGLHPDDDLIVTQVKTGIQEESITLDVYAQILGNASFLKSLHQVPGYFPGGTRSIAIDEQRLKQLGIRASKMLIPTMGTYWGEKDDFLHSNANPTFHQGTDLSPPLLVGWALEKGSIEDQRVQVRSSSRLIVIGNVDFIRDESLTRAAPDIDFLLLCVNWLTDREQLLAIAPKAPHPYMLDLTPIQSERILFLTVIGIPLLVAILGTAIWAVRRQ